MPAGYEGHVETRAAEGAGERCRALEMPDPQQMLDIEKDAPAHGASRLTFIASMATRPSPSTANTCTAAQSMRTGGLPIISQPVASDSAARMMP